MIKLPFISRGNSLRELTDTTNLYDTYRRGLITRHLCETGRVMSYVLLGGVEGTDAARTIEVNGKPYGFKITRVDNKAVGGGDSPVHHGGLALATFSIETLLGYKESFQFADLIVQFLLQSQAIMGPRHNLWRDPEEITKDDLCGLLLGLHYYLRAAKQADDVPRQTQALKLLRALGEGLKADEYSQGGSWLFQFPFTRVFKFGLGSSYLSRSTWPDLWGVGDEFLQILGAFRALTGDPWIYRPQDLYFDTMGWLPKVHGLANILGVRGHFHNLALYLHTALMIHDNPVNRKVRKRLFDGIRELWESYALNHGGGSDNQYLAVVAAAIADKAGKSLYGTGDRIRKLITGSDWGVDLPVSPLDQVEALQEGIGEAFTWEAHDRHGHRLSWDWDRCTKEIAPPYEMIPKDRLYVVEGVGLGYLFPRALAALYGLAPKPKIYTHPDSTKPGVLVP